MFLISIRSGRPVVRDFAAKLSTLEDSQEINISDIKSRYYSIKVDVENQKYFFLISLQSNVQWHKALFYSKFILQVLRHSYSQLLQYSQNNVD